MWDDVKTFNKVQEFVLNDLSSEKHKGKHLSSSWHGFVSCKIDRDMRNHNIYKSENPTHTTISA